MSENLPNDGRSPPNTLNAVETDSELNSPSKANEKISFENISPHECSCGHPQQDSQLITANPKYVYAIGRIGTRFPNQSIEKELAQVLGRTDTKALTDPEAVHKALTSVENRYLARQLCWITSIEGLETYILFPGDPSIYDHFIEAVRPNPRPTDVDVVIGVRGSIAGPQVCNGLILPIVRVDQIYSFDIDTLIRSIPRPEKIPAKQFIATGEDVFNRIMQMADNAGATDEHRALNYLSVRYAAIYAQTAEMFGQDFSLSSIEVHGSRLTGSRKILDVVFSYTNRNTDVTEKYFVRVDVTEEFPFLITKLAPYYDR